VQRHTGKSPRRQAFPWWLLTLASPFVETFREMREMRYLWREAVRMDNAGLLTALGYEPHTPLDAAVEATLIGLGCLQVGAVTGRTGSAATPKAQASARSIA
jgi:nucleoside-diphosphate-sugar epimerase